MADRLPAGAMSAPPPPQQQPSAQQPQPTQNHTPQHAQHQQSPTGMSQQGGSGTSFRRQRASRACETCHARKVRCDAASLGVPCTNCVAFNIECKIPSPKRKKTSSKQKDSNRYADHLPLEDAPNFGSDREDSSSIVQPSPATVETPARSDVISQAPMQMPQLPPRNGVDYAAASGMPPTTLSEKYQEQQQIHDATWSQYMKPKFARAPIKEAGRVAYLGESSNLSLLVHDKHGNSDVVHYPLPENVRGARARMNELDELELRILHERGAFLLPPRQLCDELVDAFFTWIAPVVPVIDRNKFMRRYRDPKNPPSLLLLQAILLAGSRVCTNTQLMDANGSTTPAAMTFYKRAKALYDANYEDDRVTIVQAVILMGWYWEGPEGKMREIGEVPRECQSDIASDVTKNVFYWSRVAVVIAQGSGMHRSVEKSQLSQQDKRLWKRIWWTLFTRDRSVAVALGRPCGINIEDSDVEMICEDDFIEDEAEQSAEYPPDPIHIQFFLNYVKLCEIMGLVLSQNYSVASQRRGRNNAIDLTHCDMALADWLQNCPKEVYWEKNRHHFWSALLHSNYYTTLCLLHRAHMPPAGASPEMNRSNSLPEELAYPSKNIAYQAAGMITSIVEALTNHNELRFTPAFIVYSLFSALIMHVYQMRSSNQSIVHTTQQRLTTCMNALKDVSRVWLVAKMVHTLFDSILGNKVLEERLQKAAGKRHAKPKNMHPMKNPLSRSNSDQQKRKFDEMEFGYHGGPPAAQMSYERSRPQSPVNPARDPPPMSGLGNNASPSLRQDAFMGTSRTNTRPTTPFNTYSYPGTPPDLFLHTRTSPNISQDLWQNYQPDQLFPPDTSGIFPTESPVQQSTMVDPALRASAGAPPQQSYNNPGQPPPHYQQPGAPGMMNAPSQQQQYAAQQQAQHLQNPYGQMQDTGDHQQHQRGSVDETWSNNSGSTGGGPIVPTTLNVGDWFEFFGIPNGDISALHAQQY
ncbi:hypothetical protein D6D13_01926 [Aureobasidium pullulans]|uniref:Zn(2)-C6 fungal-type domain-containing protein n=1 Tax=Aureobasidium pullulans TaxID=5580 RepID=A0A4S9D9Q4_AURPU|nr:hypothetical protein D6D13_01926 [Aureobasidium pullulans]